MLDTQTKKRIDDCRDILVGKLPDPKAQIEQITIGLIYKFMYDMDREAVELGGKVKFFADYKTPDPEFPKDRNKDKIVAFSQYSWDHLFDSKVTAADMLRLYSEAILSMDKNPNVPQLFRDIFKNAYLPYRDPETLKMFLKTIGEFEYTHSEKLGDAFEYLLSVMGSQGDAGQFRTPRHIIDFLVSAIDPDKADSISDPACGTAGFLISAYKHILLKHTKSNKDGLNIYQYNKFGDQKPFNNLGDLLTPDDRKKLIENFAGYDISPDMVRLSLVNLYLHGFAHPHIYEYDTLSSEERWNESFDVILANPPFMTPKGGIRPHKRFGVQANKAEVLFTDYIAEHLNSKGRAGIVVPNGIVATSQTAYKQLRKMLVKDSLIAVISLPAGVFQPYSGVKTSILILDKALAKKSRHILFLKIENDGYDLGAQRREIEKNDLPLALEILDEYKKCLNYDSPDLDDFFDSIIERNQGNPSITKIKVQTMGILVEKEKILNNKDINLNAERYFETKIYENVEVEVVKLETIVDILDHLRKPISKSKRKNGTFPYYGATGIVDYVDDYIFDARLVLVGEDGAKWNIGDKTAFIADGKYWVNNHAHVLRPIKTKVIDTYLVEILNYMDLNPFITGVTVPKLNQENLRSIVIPLPPFEIQQQIVAEIEGYQKIIDGAKEVVNNYKPSISVKDEWEMVALGEVAKIKGGYAFKSDEFVDTGIQVLKISNVKTGQLVLEKNAAFMPFERKEEFAKYLINKGDILITMTGTEGKRDYGDVCLVATNGQYLLNQRVGKVELKSDEVSNAYLALAMMSPMYQDEIFRKATGVRQSNVSGTDLEEIKIPLPSLEEQLTIVETIQEEMQLVNANKRLIEIFEQKIKDKIGEVWGVKEEVMMAEKR